MIFMAGKHLVNSLYMIASLGAMHILMKKQSMDIATSFVLSIACGKLETEIENQISGKHLGHLRHWLH